MDINERSLELGSKRSVIRELFEYGKKRKAEIGADKVYDFSLGNPSVKPPKMVEETLKSLLLSVDPSALHGYTSAQGDLATRTAVANTLNKLCDFEISPDFIYMTCGAAASLTVSLKAVLNRGDECIVFAPFFTEYRVFIENADGKVVISTPDESNFQIDFADLSAKITVKTKAVIINSPNNPSGVVYTYDTIKKLSDILRKKSDEIGHTIFLISDEPYRELVYNGQKIPFIMNYYDNSLVCYSYSKSLSLPGERIGYIAVSPRCADAEKVYNAVCGAGRSLGFVCAPSLFQKLIAECADLTVDISAYKENREILYENLKSMGYKCVKPDGAFYLLVGCFGLEASEFSEKAKKHELLVVPCDDFGIKGYVRIAYCVSKETIVNSLPAFKALSKEFL
ncbi:MAG: pyridoxal phosphate-dependent aminotransferase [Clostridia bacterium]|nr:pyridoxal phosphate-dependent aminotransferase [Clostridia bacterium]